MPYDSNLGKAVWGKTIDDEFSYTFNLEGRKDAITITGKIVKIIKKSNKDIHFIMSRPKSARISKKNEIIRKKAYMKNDTKELNKLHEITLSQFKLLKEEQERLRNSLAKLKKYEDRIMVGSIITLKNNNNKTKMYTIVDKDEYDVHSEINANSTVASRIFVKHKGDYVKENFSYKENGKECFIHGNRGKSNQNKKSEALIQEIENLYLKDYYDHNFEHFYEDFIYGNYDISYDTMLKTFTRDGILSPLAHKKTIKTYKEEMNDVIRDNNINAELKEKKIELYKSRIIETEKAHTRRSSNLYAFGQDVQMDACEKYWFGGIVSYLHLAVDKATKKVLFGWFEWEEITRGYFVLLFHIIINYGIPAKIKADNRSTFTANNAKDKKKH